MYRCLDLPVSRRRQDQAVCQLRDIQGTSDIFEKNWFVELEPRFYPVSRSWSNSRLNGMTRVGVTQGTSPQSHGESKPAIQESALKSWQFCVLHHVAEISFFSYTKV